ncbi:MAG: hypothetical protein Fur0010_21710 [Bdellovibrio sp.]
MNQIIIFGLFFLGGALFLIALYLFLKKFEFRRFISYQFPEAWPDILTEIFPPYKALSLDKKNDLHREILILMGKLDFDSGKFEHFPIKDKLNAVLWIIENKISATKIIAVETENKLLDKTLYFKLKKNGES